MSQNNLFVGPVDLKCRLSHKQVINPADLKLKNKTKRRFNNKQKKKKKKDEEEEKGCRARRPRPYDLILDHIIPYQPSLEPTPYEYKMRLTEFFKYPKLITTLIHEIDDLNDDNLNEHKDAVIQYFDNHKIDYHHLSIATHNEFINQISFHCKNKIHKSKLSQIVKRIKQQHNAQRKQDLEEFEQTLQAIKCEDIIDILKEIDAKEKKEKKLRRDSQIKIQLIKVTEWVQSTWCPGSLCEIFTGKMWTPGRITKTFINQEGDWLIVEFQCDDDDDDGKDTGNAAAIKFQHRKVRRDDSKSVQPLQEAMPVYEWAHDVLMNNNRKSCKYEECTHI